MESASRLLRLLVLGRDALQRNDKVLQGPLLLAAPERLAVHEVVETSAALQDVVETAHDAEDAEREDPSTDDSDNGGLVAVLEPAENAEQSGDDVDNEHGARQLPRGNRRPEGTIGTEIRISKKPE